MTIQTIVLVGQTLGETKEVSRSDLADRESNRKWGTQTTSSTMITKTDIISSQTETTPTRIDPSREATTKEGTRTITGSLKGRALDIRFSKETIVNVKELE